MRYKGTIVFIFEDDDQALDFGQKFHVGMKDNWPEDRYDLGDYPFDTFKITGVHIEGKRATLKLNFHAQDNQAGRPIEEFDNLVIEDFDALAGIDVPGEWRIESAVAEVSPQGGRKRRTKRRRYHKKSVLKTVKHSRSPR